MRRTITDVRVVQHHHAAAITDRGRERVRQMHRVIVTRLLPLPGEDCRPQGDRNHGRRPSHRKRLSRRLLLTTNTEENAIAAPASIGLSRPAAASGNAATL